MDPEDRQELGAVVILLAFLILVVTCSCQTAAAIEELPDGYWAATEGLFVAALQDLWSVVRWIFGLP